jgi:hypothetical protein
MQHAPCTCIKVELYANYALPEASPLLAMLKSALALSFASSAFKLHESQFWALATIHEYMFDWRTYEQIVLSQFSPWLICSICLSKVKPILPSDLFSCFALSHLFSYL